MRDVIGYAINYCVWRCDISKISVFDKTVNENPKKREIKKIWFYCAYVIMIIFKRKFLLCSTCTILIININSFTLQLFFVINYSE